MQIFEYGSRYCGEVGSVGEDGEPESGPGVEVGGGGIDPGVVVPGPVPFGEFGFVGTPPEDTPFVSPASACA